MAWEEFGSQGSEGKTEDKQGDANKDAGKKGDPPTQEAIDRFYGKWKTAEEARVSDKQENDRKFAELADHNKKLFNAIESDKQTRTDKKETDDEEAILDEIEAVDTEIANMPDDEGANKKILALQMKARRLDRKYNKKLFQKANKPPVVKEEKTDTEVTDRNVGNDLLLKDFKRINPWYGKNERMTMYAEGLGGKMNATGAYSYSELLDKVAEATKKEFENETDNVDFGGVEGGQHGNEDTGKSDELTAEDKKMADSMQVSHEDWAKQVKIINGKGKK